MIQLPKLHFVPSPNFSSRNGVKVDKIVVHSMEGSYIGSISWFAQKKSQVSAHLLLKADGSEVCQMVHFDDKAWHVVKFNPDTVGLEIEGHAAAWFPDTELAAAANIVSWLLKEFGLPVRWAEHGQGSGFCSHYDLGAAGGGHKDITTDPAKWQHFVSLVKAVDQTQLPPIWPFADPGKGVLDHSNLGPD